MAKPLIILILILTGTLTGMSQSSILNNPLIKARYLVSEKMYADAIVVLENQQQLIPESDRKSLAMGQALSELGKFDESNKWLLQITREGTAEAAYLLSKNFLELNDIPSALQYLVKHLASKDHYPEKQIRLDPAFSKLENNRDWIHLWQTEWYSELEKQIAECEYLIYKNQTDEAEALINQLLSSNPNDPQPWVSMAQIRLIQKKSKDFLAAIERAWSLASNNLQLKDELLQLAMKAGSFEKANSMASELIRLDPTNPGYLISRALIRILDGKESLALKEIESVEDAGIAPAELYYQAALKISSSIPVQAELYLTKAIESEPMDARFYYVRGTIRSGLDRTEEALNDMAMSLDINPNQPTLYLNRAQIRYDNGDSEGACHDWKKALELGNAKAADLLYKHCKLP